MSATASSNGASIDGAIHALREDITAALTRLQANSDLPDLDTAAIVESVAREAETAYARQQYAAERTEFVDRRDALIVNQWRSGIAERDIAADLNLSIVFVQSVITKAISPSEQLERRRQRLRQRGHPFQYSEEEILNRVRQAADELGRSPSTAAYDRLAVQREWPRTQTIMDRFGGWSVVVERAGLEPHRRPKGMGLPTFTDEDYAEALRRVAGLVDCRPSIGQYNTLRRSDEPTSHAFRKHFGSWMDSLDECLGKAAA